MLIAYIVKQKNYQLVLSFFAGVAKTFATNKNLEKK